MTELRDTVRVGVIGTGAISQVVHVPIFAERRDVELIALCDRDVHKAETLSRRFDVPLVLEPSDLVALDHIDAVVICTPNDSHEKLALAALEAGKHVFVERPLALSAEGADRVLAAAESSGLVLSVGMPHRFRPEVLALRSFVEGGELGDLYAARGSWLTRAVPMARSGWRDRPEVAGGGALVDLGVPALDMCLWVLGYPAVKRVRCVLHVLGADVERGATVMLETEDGLALTLEVSNVLFASEDRYYLRVMGTEGSGILPPLEVFKQLGGRPMDVTPRQPRPRGGENPYMNAYRRLLDDFVRCVAGVSEHRSPLEHVQLMKLIAAAYRSAAEGVEVTP